MEVLVDTTNICTSPKHTSRFTDILVSATLVAVTHTGSEMSRKQTYARAWWYKDRLPRRITLNHTSHPLLPGDEFDLNPWGMIVGEWILNRVHSLGTPEFSSSLLRTVQMHLSYDFASSFSVDIHMLMLLNESKPMCTRVDFRLWLMTRVFCSLLDKFVGVHTCWSVCRLMNRLNPPVGSTTAAAGGWRILKTLSC